MHSDDGFLFFEVEDSQCKYPSTEVKEEFCSGVKKLPSGVPLEIFLISNKVFKNNCLFDVRSSHVVSA